MIRRKQSPFIALLLAVVLGTGCHKNDKPNPETPPANTPAAAQPAAPEQSAPNAAQAPQTQPAPSPQGAQLSPAQSQATTSVPGQAAPAGAPVQAQSPAAAPLPVVPAGTVLRVRMNQTINVKHASSGEPFSGTVVDPILVDGNTVVPAGSTAEGIVVRAHKRGLTRTKKGKGKRTAAFIGGGSGLGMLIGGVATGGVGLVVGGLAGAGAGTGVAAFTGNKDITIPAESVVSFRLANSVHLR
jgi:hypothetical protein